MPYESRIADEQARRAAIAVVMLGVLGVSIAGAAWMSATRAPIRLDWSPPLERRDGPLTLAPGITLPAPEAGLTYWLDGSDDLGDGVPMATEDASPPRFAISIRVLSADQAAARIVETLDAAGEEDPPSWTRLETGTLGRAGGRTRWALLAAVARHRAITGSWALEHAELRSLQEGVQGYVIQLPPYSLPPYSRAIGAYPIDESLAIELLINADLDAEAAYAADAAARRIVESLARSRARQHNDDGGDPP